MIDHPMEHDNGEQNHPVRTFLHATLHVTGKRAFPKIDCSKAYHCVQLADDQSLPILATYFASRTIAYISLPQGLKDRCQFLLV